MRAVVAIVMAGLLAGCVGSHPSYSENSGEARKKALDDLLADVEAESKSASAKAYGTSPSDYKIDPDKLEKTYAEIRRRESGGIANDHPAAEASLQAPTSKWGDGWEVYGDWYVKALHDEMDTVTHVRLFTEFTVIKKEPPYININLKDPNFGFEVFGGTLVIPSPSMFLGGKGYWPFCENDLSSVSVDGAKAVRLAVIERGGACASVDKNGSAISQFHAGTKAKMRIDSDDGTISLVGFSKAWNRAMQLSK